MVSFRHDTVKTDNSANRILIYFLSAAGYTARKLTIFFLAITTGMVECIFGQNSYKIGGLASGMGKILWVIVEGCCVMHMV